MRGKTTEDWRLLELLDPVAEAQGLAIVRLRLMGAAPVRRLQIMAERPGGSMPIEDCTRLSRAVLDVLEAANPIGGDYGLEVSSPGIDRPLTRLEDFETFAGCEARLELDRLADNRRRFKGRLTGVDGRSVGVLMEGEDEPARVPFDWISEAKLVITDELLKRGAEARAVRLNSSPAGETEDHPEEKRP